MWGLIFGGAIGVGIVGIIYIIFSFRKFAFIKRINAKNKKLALLISVLIPAVVMGALLLWSVTNGVIVIIHWLVILLICNLMAFICKKISKKHKANNDGNTIKPYWAGLVAIIITIVYLTYGWISAHNVVETRYTVETEKLTPEESFRILQISDSHTGALFDGQGFMDYAAEMQATNPDIVLFTGDLVDDNSSYEDMVLSCKALGSIKSTYGSYYIYGNHDKRYFRGGGYTAEQLKQCLIENGVKIIEDNHVNICNDKISIIGRQDASVKTRKPAIVLKDYLNDDMFMVVLDHQPNDYKAEKAMKFDLVLSGHTHGGQMFPIGQFSKLFGINDMIYGMEKQGDTTFIVNSGIADWEIPFKTGCISEYVVIDVVGTKK